jgi:hypothetical protein
MKIKNGFTTNSSSSSFVIAVKSDATIESIAACFSDDSLRYFLVNNLEYIYDLQDDARFSEEISLDEKVKTLRLILASKFLSSVQGNSLKLGDWKVAAQEGSNEDGGLLGLFLYEGSSLNNDILKTQGYY